MAISTKGTKLQLRASTSSAFGNVYQVTDLSMGALTRERIDVTHLGTTNDQRSYIGGFIELGEVTFSVNYDPNQASHSGQAGGLAGLLVNGTTYLWRVQPGGSTTDPITFSGYVSNFQPNFAVGEAAAADVSIQITTLPAYSTSTT